MRFFTRITVAISAVAVFPMAIAAGCGESTNNGTTTSASSSSGAAGEGSSSGTAGNGGSSGGGSASGGAGGTGASGREGAAVYGPPLEAGFAAAGVDAEIAWYFPFRYGVGRRKAVFA